MFTSTAPRKRPARTRRAYYMSAARARRSRHDLDAEKLLAHEHVVAMLERRVLLDAEEGAVLRSEIGQDDAGRSLAVHRDLRVAAADERVLREVHIVPVAAERHHLADGAHDEPDVAAAQELD